MMLPHSFPNNGHASSLVCQKKEEDEEEEEFDGEEYNA
jgi:hypothetical protein